MIDANVKNLTIILGAIVLLGMKDVFAITAKSSAVADIGVAGFVKELTIN